MLWQVIKVSCIGVKYSIISDTYNISRGGCVQVQLILEQLVKSSLLKQEDIDLVKVKIEENGSVVQFILDNFGNKVTSRQLSEILASLYHLPLIDITKLDPLYFDDIIDIEIIEQYRVLPLVMSSNYLKLIISDPTNKDILNEISFKTSKALQFVIADHESLNTLIDSEFSSYNTKNMEDISTDLDNEVEEGISVDSSGFVNSEEDDKPIVKFVHKIVADAVNIGASDIHFEPYEQTYRIRYRIDGLLVEASSLPINLKDKISARIKVVAKLDISEKRIPQDGRLRLMTGKNKIIDFRVSSLPTAYGEKIVLRILDRNSASLGIDALGFEEEQKAILMDTITRPYGMMLVTGPTGSGKTVTLYSCLNLLNNIDKNISTAEDPIEIPLAGINQVSVNEKTGLTFAVALRAFLRQDPDIVMVGEIRDVETAEIAIKAAQTGHLVLSTLHTNDASTALTRLVSMGIPNYNVGDAVLTIIAQRLIRKLCGSCKTIAIFERNFLLKTGFTEEDISDPDFKIFKAVGCDKCHHTGYKGRIGIFETLAVSESIRYLILQNATAMDISAQARKEGIKTLRQSGLLKVRKGTTSLSEVEANTNL